MKDKFRPALIIVDFQEDFCPPNGSLAVPDGRSILPILNRLLSLPFPMKLATRDWHPRSHISFADNHPAGSKTTAKISHPSDPSQSYTTNLWPVHCVAGTPGAQLAQGLNVDDVQLVLDKGQREDVEMYSAFYDPFKVEESGLAMLLRVNGVTDVFIAGLASDFCVKATAEDAVKEGYRTFIIEEGTKAVFPDKWPQTRSELVKNGVQIISIDGDEIAQVCSK